ncbi:hypothetical protein GCM10009565_53180 [Amycolatopsis albidoflavus]
MTAASDIVCGGFGPGPGRCAAGSPDSGESFGRGLNGDTSPERELNGDTPSERELNGDTPSERELNGDTPSERELNGDTPSPSGRTAGSGPASARRSPSDDVSRFSFGTPRRSNKSGRGGGVGGRSDEPPAGPRAPPSCAVAGGAGFDDAAGVSAPLPTSVDGLVSELMAGPVLEDTAGGTPSAIDGVDGPFDDVLGNAASGRGPVPAPEDSDDDSACGRGEDGDCCSSPGRCVSVEPDRWLPSASSRTPESFPLIPCPFSCDSALSCGVPSSRTVPGPALTTCDRTGVSDMFTSCDCPPASPPFEAAVLLPPLMNSAVSFDTAPFAVAACGDSASPVPTDFSSLWAAVPSTPAPWPSLVKSVPACLPETVTGRPFGASETALLLASGRLSWPTGVPRFSC